MSFLSTKWKAKSKGKAPASPSNANASAAGIATHVAEIGNMGRTHFEGAMTPSQHFNAAHLNTVVPAPKAPSTTSKAPRFTNAGYAPPGNNIAPNNSQVHPYTSLATHYIPTIPMSSHQLSNNHPPAKIINTGHFTPSMKPTSQQKKFALQNPNQQHQPLPPLPPAINIIPATSPHGPIKTASVFTSPTDLRMASQHPKLSSMAPSSPAHKSQLAWAQSVIPTLTATTCPENNKFKYIAASALNNHVGGFQCSGGRHFISDALVASGSPGIYLLLDPNDTGYLAGPYFPSTTEKGMLLYAGEMPKVPPHAPDFIGGAYKGNFNAKTGEKESVKIGRTILGRASDRDILDIARGLGVQSVTADEARRICLEYVNSTG